MRFGFSFFVAAAVAAVLGLAPAARAECSGKADVEGAFIKQVTGKGWRSVITSTDAEGQSQEEIYEFGNPDRMYRKVATRGETIETIGIGKWAWTNIGGGYTELQPQFAQMVTSRREQAFVKPSVSTEFRCLGTVSYEGKDFVGYQTEPEAQADGSSLARTILIDPASGLPAFNLVSSPGSLDKAMRREAFSYPDTISIEKPL